MINTLCSGLLLLTLLVSPALGLETGGVLIYTDGAGAAETPEAVSGRRASATVLAPDTAGRRATTTSVRAGQRGSNTSCQATSGRRAGRECP